MDGVEEEREVEEEESWYLWWWLCNEKGNSALFIRSHPHALLI